MQRLITSIALVFIVLIPFAGRAHGYWIETSGSHKVKEAVVIKIYFGEYITGERLSGNFLDRMKEFRMFIRVNGKEEPMAIRQLADYWEGTYTPLAEGVYEFVAVNEEREVQDWTKHHLGIVRPVQYLKTVYVVGNGIPALSPASFLDITVVPAGTNEYAIQAFKNKSPYAAAKIIVTHPDGEETTLHAGNDGKTTFKAPGKGLYVVDIEWTDKTPGRFKDKAYESIRYKLDFSIYN